jgi:transcriptional regulator with XRE-family HTH domain
MKRKKIATEASIKLKNIREVFGKITQEELAKMLNTSVKNISRWENGTIPLGVFMFKIDELAEHAKVIAVNQEKFSLPYFAVKCVMCYSQIKTKKSVHNKATGNINCKPCAEVLGLV